MLMSGLQRYLVVCQVQVLLHPLHGSLQLIRTKRGLGLFLVPAKTDFFKYLFPATTLHRSVTWKRKDILFQFCSTCQKLIFINLLSYQVLKWGKYSLRWTIKSNLLYHVIIYWRKGKTKCSNRGPPSVIINIKKVEYIISWNSFVLRRALSTPVLLSPVLKLLLPQSHLPLPRLQIESHVGTGWNRLTCMHTCAHTHTKTRINTKREGKVLWSCLVTTAATQYKQKNTITATSTCKVIR